MLARESALTPRSLRCILCIGCNLTGDIRDGGEAWTSRTSAPRLRVCARPTASPPACSLDDRHQPRLSQPCREWPSGAVAGHPRRDRPRVRAGARLLLQRQPDGEVSVDNGAGSAVTDIPPKATFSYEALCGTRRHKLAQPFVALFRPGAKTKVAIHDAEYFRYVLEGRIIFRFKGERHELKAGDAIYHDATAGQEIECVGKQPAKLLTIFVKPAQFGAAIQAARLSADPGRALVLEGHL